MPRYRFAWPLAALVACSAFSQFPGATPPPALWKKGFDSITTNDSRKFLEYLAGPECMGRGTGQPGFQKAAEYVAARFKEYGLKPIGDNGTYFQNVPFWRAGFVDKGSEIKVIGNGKTISAGEAFRLSSITAPLDATSLVVEITPNGNELNVEGMDLEKRIVLLRSDNPPLRMRSDILRARPAVLLIVKQTVPPNEYTVRRSAPTGDTPARSPYGTISAAAAAELLGALNMRDANGGRGPSAAAVRMSSEFVRVVAKSEAGPIGVPNVVGMIEGTDPTLKAETVGLGSHLDHLGVQNGQVYWGADDDGSGTTALIQVAKAFASNPVKPKRSLIFMAFCGEEMGLVGSGYYSSNPIFPHDKMVAELQMDMVGRNSSGAQNGDRNRMDVEAENRDTIRLVGSKRISMELHNIILDLNKHVGFKFKYDAEDVYTRSDHYQFAKHGIPIAFLFTGFHPDYHQPTDTIEKINFGKIANTAKLFYLTAASLATRQERLKIDPKS